MLAERNGLAYVYSCVDLPLLPVLVEMEQTGVLIDTAHLAALGVRIDARLTELTATLYAIAGAEINLNSPVQVGAFLFDYLGLPEGKKTGRSTEKAVLDRLASLHPAVESLLEYRQLSKLKGTYVDKLPRMLRPTGRLHAQFNNTRVETGRLSSSDPNLQNIPARSELGKEIRKAFIAPEGHKIVAFDQSAVEFKILCCLAEDWGTIADINAGRDIHCATAAKVAGEDYDSFMARMAAGDKSAKDQRTAAKTTNYGVAYGMTEDALSVALKIEKAEAKRIMDSILGMRPRVVEWIERTKWEVRRWGYVETYFGRRAYYPDAQSDEIWKVRAAEREAVNCRIQGTAADIMKIALARIWREKERRGMESKFLIQCHDEGDLEAPDAEVEELMGIIPEQAETVVDWPLRLTVEVGAGPSWGEAK